MMSIKACLGVVAALSALLLMVPWAGVEAAGAPVKREASTAPKRPSNSRPPSKQGTPKAAVTANSFTASGLFNEDTLTALFRGDFNSIDFNRDDLKFEALFQGYLNAYAQRCEDHLPKNRVEMTFQRCDLYNVTRNGFGVEISRTCAHYETEGTGLYADPRLYAAMKEVDRLIAADSLRQLGRLLLGQGGPAGGAMNMINLAQATANDVNALVQMNDCSSPGLKRFEENLRLFALNQRPVPLDGNAAPSSVAGRGAALSEQEYADLIKDLVADQARTWVANRFVSGSVTNISVSSRDPAGRPSKMAAEYAYDGFNGRSWGSVSVHFIDGVPDCIYFSDAPATCQTPSRKITASYTTGVRARRSTGVALTPVPAPTALTAKPVAADPMPTPAVPADAPPPPGPRREL